MIKNKEKVTLNGQMVESILEDGLKENSMVMGSILNLELKLEMENGRKERESGGLKMKNNENN